MDGHDDRVSETSNSDNRAPRPSARAFVSATGSRLGKMALNVTGNVRQLVSKEPRSGLSTADIKTLKTIVRHSKEEIARVQTVFPFTLFPDDIILDRTKITIIKRNFFWSAEVISIRIEDIFNVSSSVGPFLGSITVSSRIMNSVDHFEIDRLWRRDAIEVKTLIQGYMIAKHNNVELDHLTVEEMIETLQEFGGETGDRGK